MIGPCPYLCDKKTEQGYCLYTACRNPKYSSTYMPVKKDTYTTIGEIIPTPLVKDATSYHKPKIKK